MVKNQNTTDQGQSVRHGFRAGYLDQGANSVAIGPFAGQTSQAGQSIAIGIGAGADNQGQSSVAIGINSAVTNQYEQSVAIGNYAGNQNQNKNAVAIGSRAGFLNQLMDSISIGSSAGNQNQNTRSIAVGSFSGFSEQKDNCIAIGYQAGYENQNTASIAIGTGAGYTSAGIESVSIGSNAGYSNMGDYSIAMGARGGFYSNNNTISLNASGDTLNAPTSNAFYVKPIRFSESLSANVLTYISSSGEVVDSNAITFRAGSTLVGISNSNPVNMLDVGNKISVHSSGDKVLSVHGDMSAMNINLSKNLVVEGNIHVHGTETIMNTEKILIEDPIIELANNIIDENQDVGIIMRRPNSNSSVFMGYHGGGSVKEFSIGYTRNNIHSTTLSAVSDEKLPVNIHGTLDVSEVLTVDPTASNVVEVTGNVNATDSLLASHVVAHEDLWVGGTTTTNSLVVGDATINGNTKMTRNILTSPSGNNFYIKVTDNGTLVTVPWPINLNVSKTSAVEPLSGSELVDLIDFTIPYNPYENFTIYVSVVGFINPTPWQIPITPSNYNQTFKIYAHIPNGQSGSGKVILGGTHIQTSITTINYNNTE